MAEFKEVMKMRNYMCDKMNSCINCPISPQTHHVQSCDQFLQEYSDEAEKLITEWYNKYKPRTNAEMLKRVFGNDVPFNIMGCQGILTDDCMRNCSECPYDQFWKQEYKGGFKYE